MSLPKTMADADRHNARVAANKRPPMEPVKLSSPSAMSEAEIQGEIADYLRSIQAYFVRHAMHRPTTCDAGTPDFIGWKLGFPPFAFEVKRPKGKTTPEQNGQLHHAKREGGTAAVVHSVAEVKLFFESAMP